MFIHINESKEAEDFLAQVGLKITKKSSHNAVTLKNVKTGEKLQLWAESDSSIAAGIPGIFIDEEK